MAGTPARSLTCLKRDAILRRHHRFGLREIRGHDRRFFGFRFRLFKRDFGGFWLDNFPDLQVVKYGFSWKRLTGLDNLTWWVFEKRA